MILNVKIDTLDLVNQLSGPELDRLIGFAQARRAALGNSEMTEHERKLCDEGKIIASIKAVRARTRLGLREAKCVVERYRAGKSS